MGVRTAISVALAAATVTAACGGTESRNRVDGSVPPPDSVGSSAPAPTSTPLEPPAPTSSGPAMAPVESVRFVDLGSVTIEPLAEQQRRATLGGADTFYWPDGNIGSFVDGDGMVRYFAANGDRIAQTVGTSVDPTLELVVADQAIEGIPDEFPYAAGGPVHLDPASGTLLLWYHAERYPDPERTKFHAAIGLARSDDGGETFTDLGIIIETNAAPDWDTACCADVGGGPVVVRDGVFHLWFRDRQADAALTDVQLALATASVDDVVAAALVGEAAPWSKYDDGEQTPGRGGTSSPLEAGNPRTSWFDVAWHDGLGRFLMVIARHGSPTEPSELSLISSPDGIEWTPRQLLTACECELTYPSFIDTVGSERLVTDDLTIVYVTTPPTVDFRWQDTTLQRMRVSVGPDLVTSPTSWTFDTDAGGWSADGDAIIDGVFDGQLVVSTSGADPYLTSPSLGLSTDEFGAVEVTMASGSGGTGQLWFTTDSASSISEDRSVFFAVDATDTATTYSLDLSSMPGWDGLLDTLRLDPIDQNVTVRIESIELVPR